MDKETLSNYGWIVVLVLILAVMLALASPFGSFISTAIKDVTGGFWDVNSASLNAVGLDTGDIGFDGDPASCGVEGHYIGDDKGEHGIPVEDCKSGHTYTCECDGWVVPDDGKYTMKSGTVYTAGQQLPCGYTAVSGDKYIDKYYEYSCSYNRWHVKVLDKTLISYGEIIESIAYKLVTNMNETFKDCTSLKTPPAIPNSVATMENTFYNCTSLTTAPILPNQTTSLWYTFNNCTNLKTYVGNKDADGDFSNYIISNSVTNMVGTFKNCKSLTVSPKLPNNITNMESTFEGCESLITASAIPNNVWNMYKTFSGCKSLTVPPDMSKSTKIKSLEVAFQDCSSLKTAPTIPNSVTSMYYTFKGCESLTTAPTIPNSVTNIFATFYDCTSLTGTIEINANPTSYNYCFYNVNFKTKNITLTGTSTKLDEIGATGKNYCSTCNGTCSGTH